MIQHLNQLSLYHFGVREPGKDAQSIRQAAKTIREEVLNGEMQNLFRTTADTYIIPKGGMTVLSVSTDGKKFESFYLDQIVRLYDNVCFYLSPLRGENAGAEFCAAEAPQIIESRTECRGDHVHGNMRVTGVFTFFYHEKEPGFFFPGESHPVLELTYVDRGTMHSVVDGQEWILEQGDVALYGAGQWHVQYADMNVAPRYVTISFEVENGDLQPLLNRKLRPSQAGVTLIQQMIREQDRMDAYSMDMIGSLLTQLLLQLLRHQGTTEKLMASNSLNSENEIICRAQQYISTHIREKLSVPHVARMVDVSPSYMTALFHKNLQISPGEYIRRIKIQESKQMIREGNMNFTEIAEALHYSTVHHFSRQFKDKVGFTPTEYAKSVR